MQAIKIPTVLQFLVGNMQNISAELKFEKYRSSVFGPRDCGLSSREGCAWFWWGDLRERDHWGDPDVDGRIILRWIFRKWEGVVGTGWSWLRIGTGGGHL